MGSTREELRALVRSYIEKCNRCGDCRAVCPVFRELPTEAAVARGKLFLAERLLNGDLEQTEEVRELMDRCLLCMHCTFRCAFHLRVDRVIAATRAALAAEAGLPPAKRALFSLLGEHAGLLRAVCSAGGLTARVWGRRIPETSGLHLRLPAGRVLAPDHVVPRPAVRSFRSRTPAFLPASRQRATVAFFTGCYVDYLSPEVGRDTVRLLARDGVAVHVPGEQVCCGFPMLASGDLPAALRLMRRNLEGLLAVPADAVVVACATCGSALRDYYPEFLGKLEPALAEKAAQLAAKTYDIAAFLTDVVPLPGRPKLREEVRLTYHDSCHLARGQGVRSQPRQLLRSIGNVAYVEMEEADACCGGGGAFSFTQHDIATRICARKVGSIRASGAQIVVSGCHGCNLQITEGLAREGIPSRTMHTVQVLEMAYREDRE